MSEGGPTVVPDEAVVAAVRRLRAGVDVDAAAAALDAKLRPRLRRYFQRPPLTAADAEDLVQKTLLLVFQNVGTLEHEESFLPWLFRIAHNERATAANRQRREQRVLADGLDLAVDRPDARRTDRADTALAGRERLAQVRAGLAALPDRQRQCLTLQIRDELSYEEIATVLRLSVNTVRNHIAQAREALRRRLAAGPESIR